MTSNRELSTPRKRGESVRDFYLLHATSFLIRRFAPCFDSLDNQEDTLNKRQKQLEEMQNQLSSKLALLDEKEVRVCPILPNVVVSKFFAIFI